MTRWTSLGAALLAAFVVFMAAPSEAEACRCTPPDVASSYNKADEVMQVTVLKRVVYGHWTVYYARNRATYKGCQKRNQIVRLLTPTEGATCGARLTRGQTYLVNGHRVYRGYLSINSCDYNRPIRALTREDRQYLDTRYNCCGGECACVNSPEVQCFANPCDVAPACDDGTCHANYCGGCNAEFYNDLGEQVCLDNDTPCESDDDCGSGTWCRPNQNNINECVPFSDEGDYCGGFTPIWAQSRCAPGLICTDVPDFIADAPGRCRAPCRGNDDCDQGQYCSGNGACRDDGACYEHNDCEAEGNNWSHIECVGYGVCGGGECGWECGDERCRDLSGSFFGFCDAVLGVGIVNGECQTISGCDNEGQPLFRSMDACRRGCE